MSPATSGPRFHTRPITLRDARRYIAQNHRHALPTVGWRFGTSLYSQETLVGVGVAGRPTARHLDDGVSIEITRCTTDGTRNACSAIYGSLCRAATALGYVRAYTYTRGDEDGASVLAAGFTLDAVFDPRDPWIRPGQGRYDIDLFGTARHDQGVSRRRWRRDLQRKHA